MGWLRGGYTVRPHYTPHWRSLCGSWGHTLSGSLFWLSLHAAVPQQILLNVCGRDLNVMQSLWGNSVPLTKYYFFVCSVGFSDASWGPFSQEPLWIHQQALIYAGSFDISAKLDYNYVYQSPFLLLLIFAWGYNQINETDHKYGNSCSTGWRQLPRKAKRLCLYVVRLQVTFSFWFGKVQKHWSVFIHHCVKTYMS